VRLWNPATGQPVGAPLHTGTGHIGGVPGVAFSPDGKLLASVDLDSVVRLWNPATGRAVGAPLRPAGAPLHAATVYGVDEVAFSPDGQLLASAASDGTVRLWNPATGQPVGAPLHATSARYGVNAVAFSPNGRLLASADGDGTVRLWNPATGQPDGAPLRPVRAPLPGSAQIGVSGTVFTGVDGVAFSPDGTLLASANNDGTVQLWNPATGRPVSAPIQTGSGPAGGVDGVAFSPDGTLLASADLDGTVRLWHVSAFINPYRTLCTDVGAPTRQEWQQYAAGEPQPRVC